MIEADGYEQSYERLIHSIDAHSATQFNAWLFQVTMALESGHLEGEKVVLDGSLIFRVLFRVVYIDEKPFKIYLIYDYVQDPPVKRLISFLRRPW